MAVGDFNGDGICDLAVAGPNGDLPAAVSVLLSNGDGYFQAPLNFGCFDPFYPTSMAAGDFNGDGLLDLAMADPAPSTGFGGVRVLLGTGDGGFAAEFNYDRGVQPYSVAVRDFNGDGTLDLAVADHGGLQGNGAGVSVLLGNGDGSFQPAHTYDAGSGPYSVAVGDFNGDGIPDLAVANGGDSHGNGRGVSVLLGNGDGSFQAAVTYDAGGYATSVAVRDFNGDGLDDLAAATPGSNDVSILLNDNAWTGPRPGGQPSGHHRAATAVESLTAPVPALPPAADGLPTDVGTAVLGSPWAPSLPVPGPSRLRFRADADQGSATAAPAPRGAAPPETSLGGALKGDLPALALLDRLFAGPTSGWGGDLVAEQPWSSAW
jgi:hypothetical protein